MPEDIFDIVDENDRVVASALRSRVHADRLMHRAAHVLIFSKNFSKILLQKRSSKKDSYPFCWTTSCSGHIDSGETYDIGVIREMKEETGLEISISQFEKIGKISASEKTGFEWTFVYTLSIDENSKLSYSSEEIDSFKWVSLADFERILKDEPQTVTPSFVAVWNFYKQNKI